MNSAAMKASAKLLAVILSVLLACTLVPMVPAQASAALPSPQATPTKSGVYALVSKYDPDAAFIFKNSDAVGSDYMVWFTGSSLMDKIDDAAHEESHTYMRTGAKSSFAYFVGNKKLIQVPSTEYFYTQELAVTVPEKLRTYRFNTYVGNPSFSMATNINGVYGLLNEFAAYRTGMHTVVSLFPYLKAKKAGWDAWNQFMSSCENDRLAYAEFKYYILHYLYYAKRNHPAVYKAIMANKNFCKAYRLVETRYKKLISTYTADLKKLKQVYPAKKGFKVTIKSDYVLVMGPIKAGLQGASVTRYSADYNKLVKEMKKAKYSSIHNALVRNGK